MSIFDFISVWKAKQLLKKECTNEAWNHATVYTLTAIKNMHPSWIERALVVDSSYSKHLLTTTPMPMIYPVLANWPDNKWPLYNFKFIIPRIDPAQINILLWTALCKTDLNKDLAVCLYEHPDTERNTILAQRYIDDAVIWRKTLNKSFAFLIETAVKDRTITPDENWVKRVYPSTIQPNLPKSLFDDKQEQYRYQILRASPNALVHMAYHGDTIGFDRDAWPLTNPKALQEYMDAFHVLTTYYPHKAAQLLERHQLTGARSGQPSPEVNVACMLNDNANDAYTAWLQARVNPAIDVASLPTNIFDELA